MFHLTKAIICLSLCKSISHAENGMTTSIIKFEKKYMIPDYSNRQEISSVPFTAPTEGIVNYIMGDGAAGGARTITVNDTAIAWAHISAGERTTMTAIVGKNDVLNITPSYWGNAYFFPFK